jgi:hypothetical protein
MRHGRVVRMIKESGKCAGVRTDSPCMPKFSLSVAATNFFFPRHKEDTHYGMHAAGGPHG